MKAMAGKQKGLLFAVLQVTLLACSVRAQPQVTLAEDVRALLAFEAAVGSPSLLTSSWLGNNPCVSSWIGVSCQILSASRSHTWTIVGLNLSGQGLQGYLPLDLGNLVQLQSLNVSNNQLTGPIPSALGALTLLQSLDVSHNQLNGSIPAELGGCASAIEMNLSHNQLTGSVPAALGSLTNVKLSLDGNSLCNTIPGAACLLQTAAPSASLAHKASSGKKVMIILVLVGGLGAAAAALCACLFVVLRRKKSRVGTADEDEEKWMRFDILEKGHLKKNRKDEKLPPPLPPRYFMFRDIEAGTENFSRANYMGDGPYGQSYWARMDGGKEVLVKRLDRALACSGRDFRREVDALGRVAHPNLVKLIGYCMDDGMHMLVYEWLDNGSLYDHLHGSFMKESPLDWPARVKAAAGVARALAHLQDGAVKPPIIHRDFKTSSVLLDADCTAKVSEYGLCKLAADENDAHCSTRILGAFGSVAPEYIMTGQCDERSVVYTFGVLLLELMTGRKPVDMRQPVGQQSLVTWAGPHLNNQEKLAQMIDPKLRGLYPKKDLAKFAAVAAMCLQPEPDFRPIMTDVAATLESLQLYEPDVSRSESGELPVSTRPSGSNSRPPSRVSTPRVTDPIKIPLVY